MTWFKVDDSFYDHPKVFDAPDCAVALWTRAGSWAARNLTDGFVPAGMPARLCDDPDTAVRELVRRGLWSRTKDGYRFHDWADFQPSAEAVLKLRADRSAAGRKGGQAKAAKQQGRQTPGKPLASASPDAKQNAAPSRPVPPPSKEGEEGARATLRSAQRVAPSSNPDWRAQPAFGTPRDPSDAQRAQRGAAAARANIRKPAATTTRTGAFDELVAATQPPPDDQPPPVISLRSA